MNSMKQRVSLFNPFALVGPKVINTSGNPLRHVGKDWSLTFLVLVLGLGLAGKVSNSFSFSRS